MRILMLAQNYAPVVGGEERIVEDLSIELVQRGHDVAVATISPSSNRTGETRDGVRIYGLRSSVYRARRLYGGAERPQAPPAPDPRMTADLHWVLLRERPEVVHAHNWLVHSYLPLHRRCGGRALVLSLHDYGLLCATKRLMYDGAQCCGPGPAKCVHCATRHYAGPSGAVVALAVLSLSPVLRRRVDLFLPVSRAVRDRCRLGPSDPHRIVPNFIRTKPTRSTDDSILESLPRQPYVLFLGDIAPDKGALHLVKVYETLHSQPPLVLIGRCFVDEVRNVPNVTVLGPWPHHLAQEALHRCLFVTIPTIMSEAFGLVALESAAAGKAVVASGIGGLREIVRDGETGLLVPPGDEAGLRTALNRLIANESLRVRLGEAGLRHAASFAADAVVPAFEVAYQTAIDIARRRDRHAFPSYLPRKKP